MEDNKQLLDELVEMQKRLTELYERGVFSVEREFGIHVTEKLFLEMFSQYTISDRDDEEYPEKLTAHYDGAEFYCIRSKEETKWL